MGLKDVVAHLLRHRANPYLLASEMYWDAEALEFRIAPKGTSGYFFRFLIFVKK